MVIEDGSILISDCLYVIRVPQEYREALVRTLTSEYGQNWIKANSHGVCSRVISKIDLLNLEIQPLTL